MANYFGTLGAVAWGTSTDFTNQITSTHMTGATYSLSIEAPTLDATVFAASPGARFSQKVAGLRSIKGTIECLLPPGRLASTGLLTIGSFTALWDRYVVKIAAASEDVTPFNATAPTWRTFLPGIVSWSGTAEAPADDTATFPAPATSYSTTFQLVSSGSGKNLSGSLFVTNISQSVDPKGVSRKTISFDGTDKLATAGTATELWAADASASAPTVVIPVPKTLTLTTTTGLTYSGSAFFTGVELTAKVDELFRVKIDWQGTGAWTLPSA